MRPRTNNNRFRHLSIIAPKRCSTSHSLIKPQYLRFQFERIAIGIARREGPARNDVLRLPKRHPACRRREAQSGSCAERENLAGDPSVWSQIASVGAGAKCELLWSLAAAVWGREGCSAAHEATQAAWAGLVRQLTRSPRLKPGLPLPKRAGKTARSLPWFVMNASPGRSPDGARLPWTKPS